MASRVRKILVGIVVAAAAAAGLFLLGRATADTGGAHQQGYKQGHVDGYLAGLRDGAVQGRQEGRADEAISQLPAADRQAARDAFNAGYAAGANDVFAGYDGGWGFSTPYVITVEPGKGQITYRIATRTELQPGITYALCAEGKSVCPQHR